MDDEAEIRDEEEMEETPDDILGGIKNPKKPKDLEDDSLDALADEEDGILPEDAFDDTEPEDMW